MKVSKIFHYLYFSVMALPLILIPVFMIYSHRHTIDSYDVQYAQNKVVDFNQIVNNGNFENTNYWTTNNSSLNISNNVGEFVADIRFGNIQHSINGVPNHKYLFIGSAQFDDMGSDGNPLFYIASGSDNFYYDLSSVTSWQTVKKLFTATSNYLAIIMQDNRTLSTYTPINVKNIQLFDLTQMFGAGNEPTIEQFNDFYPNDYYDYTLTHIELLKGYSTEILNDTDIMSQISYNLYNSVNKYFNVSQFFGLNNLWDFMVLNWFGGNVTIYLEIFWQLLCYWLVVSIAWLIFDLFMYLPNLAHRWLDRGAIE